MGHTKSRTKVIINYITLFRNKHQLSYAILFYSTSNDVLIENTQPWTTWNAQRVGLTALCDIDRNSVIFLVILR